MLSVSASRIRRQRTIENGAMRLSFALLVALVGLAAAQLRITGSTKGIESHEQQAVEMMKVEMYRPAFLKWKSTQGKTYDSAEEEDERLMIWIQNHEYIEEHNSGTSSFTLGHNQFSDLTHDEYQRRNFLGKYSRGVVRPRGISGALGNADDEEVKSMKRALEEAAAWDDSDDDQDEDDDGDDKDTADKKYQPKPKRKPQELPESVDWNATGAVSSVKNEEGCGADWAFSAIGAVEGARFIATGNLTDLSVQHVIDCNEQDYGCRGGLVESGFEMMEVNDGVCSEADYPYNGVKNFDCDRNRCSNVPDTQVKEYIDVPSRKRALLKAISGQPVAVAIQANQPFFRFYKGGVLDDDTCGNRKRVDHAVLAVGYGTDVETGKEYWLAKNSWGECWGEDGFVKIARASKNEYGMCSILRQPLFPVLA